MSSLENVLPAPGPRIAHCFFCAPGEYAVRHCNVCGDEMEVTRDVVGPRNFAEAMAARDGKFKGVRHDRFCCPNGSADWHRQAIALRQEATQTASKRLSDLLNDEADEVVRTRTPTKPR